MLERFLSMTKILSLPISPVLTDEEVAKVVEVVNEW